MKPENRDKLEKYRPKYNLWVNDQTLDLKTHERTEIVQVIREEFNHGYTYMEWCGKCVADMLVYAFRELDKRPVQTINVNLTKTNELHSPNSSHRPQRKNGRK